MFEGSTRIWRLQFGDGEEDNWNFYELYYEENDSNLLHSMVSERAKPLYNTFRVVCGKLDGELLP